MVYCTVDDYKSDLERTALAHGIVRAIACGDLSPSDLFVGTPWLRGLDKTIQAETHKDSNKHGE